MNNLKLKNNLLKNKTRLVRTPTQNTLGSKITSFTASTFQNLIPPHNTFGNISISNIYVPKVATERAIDKAMGTEIRKGSDFREKSSH